MNIRRRASIHAEIEAASLSDILFILMMFFLMISTLISTNAIKVNLPKAGTSKAVAKGIISVYITNDLQCYVEKKPVTIEELKTFLEQEAKKEVKPSIVLKADQAADWGKVVEVMDVINQLKFSIVVAIERKK